MKHDLTHAICSACSDCTCERKDMTFCVICNKTLETSREHTDTCSDKCLNKLRDQQIRHKCWKK